MKAAVWILCGVVVVVILGHCGAAVCMPSARAASHSAAITHDLGSFCFI